MYQKNIKITSVVPSATLVDAEYYVVNDAGAKTTNRSQTSLGVVYEGRAGSQSSQIAFEGIMEAYVDGAATAITAYDPLCADGADSTYGRASADGVFTKATLGTDHVKAIALEAATSLKKIRVRILNS